MAQVHVLREGSLEYVDGSSVIKPATVTLVKYRDFDYHDKYLLVDAGGSCDTLDDLEGWLDPYNITSKDIHKIILTHNHPGHKALIRHIGSPEGAMIYGPDYTYCSCFGHEYHAREDQGYIVPGVMLLDTPGHEGSGDRSVLVNTPEGLVGIVGDLMFNSEAYKNPNSTRKQYPINRKDIISSRNMVINDYPDMVKIIPGHGQEFKIEDILREQKIIS
ncbi:MBL fold metallo-hydrolase [archaeon]|nr:MBL fold metallo-hydrolase [archaeon]